MPICCHKIYFDFALLLPKGKLYFLPIHINLSFGSFAYAFLLAKVIRISSEEHRNALKIFYAEYWKKNYFYCSSTPQNFPSILNFTSDMQKYCLIQDKLVFACEQKKNWMWEKKFSMKRRKNLKIMTDIWGVNEWKVLLKDWLKSFFGVDGDDAVLCWMMELHNLNIGWSCKVFFWFIDLY